jgi:hypothetical protein
VTIAGTSWSQDLQLGAGDIHTTVNYRMKPTKTLSVKVGVMIGLGQFETFIDGEDTILSGPLGDLGVGCSVSAGMSGLVMRLRYVVVTKGISNSAN